MSKFMCPVMGCEKELSKLQIFHFRSAHQCDPIEWVDENFGQVIRQMYSTGLGSYAIADEYEWLSRGMVLKIVESRSHVESISSGNNPMKRSDVIKQFLGEKNPAKEKEVRQKIRQSNTGHPVSEKTREKISRKNSGNTISKEHREAISKAASQMDRSYMQTKKYRNKLSEAQKGRPPTYPTPYHPEDLAHKVRSSWEEDIGILLNKWGITYEYEKEFELSIGSYYADFSTDRFVVEVKGFRNERSVKKADCFLEEYQSFTFVVVGAEIPCDIHISWEDKADLKEVLADGG